MQLLCGLKRRDRLTVRAARVGGVLLFAWIAVGALAATAHAEVIHFDDVEFFTSDYLLTYVSGNCTASMIRELGTGCIAGGNSLVVHIQRTGGPPLNYDVHLFNVAHTYHPHDDDPTSSTFSWNFYVKAVNVLDIADFQIMARQGTAEYKLGGVFEPPSNNVCHNWSGSVTLDQFNLVLGNGTNGNRLDLRTGAAPIQIGWRVYMFANPWPATSANPRISTSHFTITTTHPVVEPIANQTVAEGDTLAVTPVGSDVDGDVLTWTGANLPDGASVDSLTGVLTWMPTYDQAGAYENVTLVAADGDGGLGSASFRITVQDAPPSDVPIGSVREPAHLLGIRALSSNPFGDRIGFEVFLAKPGVVRLQILDVCGRLVSDLGTLDIATDREGVFWDGRSDDGRRVASGLYFIRASTGEVVRSLAIMKVEA